MAFNPPVNDSGLPMRVEGEYMVLERKNIEIRVKVDGVSGQKEAKGKLFITTARMVFVCDKKQPSFSSFDIPFFNIYNEKFEQPIFGANYLHIKVKPLFGMLPGDCEVKLWFMSGGCQKFLKYFMNILGQIRKRRQDGADPAFIRDLTNGTLDSKFAAYVDPNDPSVVFVSQPEVQTKNEEVRNYFAPMQEQVASDKINVGKNSGTQQFHGEGTVIGSDIPEYQPQVQQHQQYQPYHPQQYQTHDYPQQHQGYPTQSYPQQNQGYPTQSYPQQDQGYPQQSQGYPTQSYPQNQQQENTVPPPTNYQSGTDSVQSHNSGYPTFNLSHPTSQQHYPDQQQQQQQQQQPYSGNMPNQGYQPTQPQTSMWAPPQPSVGYYYGFWGPQLQGNAQQH